MTILQICLSSSLGGLELYFLETSKYLHQNSKHEVLALVRQDSRLHDKIKALGIKHFSWYEQTGKFPFISAFQIKKLLEGEAIDIVHIHCKKDLPLAAWLKTWMTGSFKLVHTRQMNMPGNKKSWYHTFQYRKIDKLLTITRKLEKDILERVKILPTRVETLYYGVQIPESFDADAFFEWSRTYESKSSDFRIAVFGNLNSTKAQHTILDALARVKNSLPANWKLYLIGKFIDPAYESVIQHKIESNKLADNVVVTGFIDNAKQWMPGFDLIVLTTLGETFGLVLVEAMKSRVAVIGTNSEGVPEIIDHGENGLLVEPNNVEQLGQAIVSLYKDASLRKRFAEKGKQKADFLFDYEQHYTRLLAIYDELREK